MGQYDRVVKHSPGLGVGCYYTGHNHVHQIAGVPDCRGHDVRCLEGVSNIKGRIEPEHAGEVPAVDCLYPALGVGQ